MKKSIVGIVVGWVIVLGARDAAADATWRWPLPADQPGIPVPCTQCDSSILNRLTAPYSDPLRFAGRFQSSHWVGARQQPFRTAYAYKAIPDRKNKRLYMQLGSAVGVYDLDTFFTRLKSRETLMSVADLPGLSSLTGKLVESFLKWDKWFYAEFTSLSQWWVVVNDGQDRLSSIDWDDRGDVYVATGQFGWGIVYDDGKSGGGFMPTRYHSPQFTAYDEEPNASFVVSLKSPTTGRYYALVGGGLSVMNVWDVTTDTRPVRKADFPHVFSTAARTDDRVAFKADDGNAYVYSIDGLLAGKPPLATFSPPPSGGIINVVTDGTNMLALVVDADRNLFIARYAPDTTGLRYTETGLFKTGKVGPPVSGIRYDSGYVAFSYRGSAGYDSALFRVTDSGLIEIPLNGYIHEYYVNSATYIGLGALPIHVQPYMSAGKLYLIVSAEDLGDVYQVIVDDRISLSPNTGPAAGGQSVTITGNNVAGAVSVTFDGLTAPITASTATAVTVTTPAHSGGPVDVIVQTSTGSVKSAGGYTYAPARPSSVVATAAAPTQVTVGWTSVTGATSYQIDRRAAGGGFVQIATSPTNSWTDTSASAGAAYLYRVRAVGTGGISPDSPADLATTVIFTNPTLSGVEVKAVHLSELRTAVAAVTTLATGGSIACTDLAEAGTDIRAVHIGELRAALDAALTALGIPHSAYGDASLAGMPIKAVHFEEIRDRVR